jgi:predicted histone-like DNA-binding protein
MSIHYKVINKGQPGVPEGGTPKYYASINTSGEVDIDKLTRDIEKISTVSGADIRAVLYALVDVAIDELRDGKIVRLGDLGSLRMSLKSFGYDTPSEVNASAIKGTRVLFTPGKKIKEMQKTLTYKLTV